MIMPISLYECTVGNNYNLCEEISYDLQRGYESILKVHLSGL